MTLALGTSSPMVSVALIGPLGDVLGERHQVARGAASGALAVFVSGLLADNGVTKAQLQRIIVDVGPGSFTGVKVGVTFAKTLAWALNIPVFAVTSFDLISTEAAVAVPSKKGEWYVRRVGQAPLIVSELDAIGLVGYGPGFETEDWPMMTDAARLVGEQPAVDPFALVPYYIADPSISVPKSHRVLPEARP
jgi:tRNA threonylcarbamoyl adenosine modification protein YeaZ